MKKKPSLKRRVLRFYIATKLFKAIFHSEDDKDE